MAAADEPLGGEQQIIQQAKDGSHDAFRLLMDRYIKRAYDVAFRFVGDHAAAEDITQEAFVKVHASLSSFRGEAEFGTWLHRIVVNIALTRKRLEKNRFERRVNIKDFHGVTHGGDYHEELYVREQRAHVERALHELPTLQRAVVILRHLNGLSTKQVSNILQCSEGTVKTHLFRGLKKMRGKLQYLQEETA